jgi:hypothetical protein
VVDEQVDLRLGAGLVMPRLPPEMNKVWPSRVIGAFFPPVRSGS